MYTDIELANLSGKVRMLKKYDKYFKLKSIDSKTNHYKYLESLKALHVYFRIVDYWLDLEDKSISEITETDIDEVLELIKKEVIGIPLET